MLRCLIDGVIVELTEEEFEQRFGSSEPKEPVTPSLEKRVAALESALVDLALSNLGVVNNA